MTFHFLQRREFFAFGQLTAIGLLQGSPGPKFFQKTVVDYILHNNVESLKPTIEEIPEESIKRSLTVLDKVENEVDFKNKACFECSFRFDAGYCKPLIELKDKGDFLQSVSLHYTILSSIKETDQFIEGLRTCNVLEMIRGNPDLFRSILQKSDVPLTAEVIDDIFEPVFSPRGSNKYSVEEKIVFNFNQYLEDIENRLVKTIVEGEEVTICLCHVLQFVTGAEDIPAIGFTPRPSIRFYHDSENPRKLSANTCGNVLTIPVTKMYEYARFSEEFTFCMMNYPGFGVL